MTYAEIIENYIRDAEQMGNSATVGEALDRVRRLNWWLNQVRAHEMKPDFPEDEEQYRLFLMLSDWLIAHADAGPEFQELERE